MRDMWNLKIGNSFTCASHRDSNRLYNLAMHSVKSHAGFTFIEIMVAISIIALVLTGIYKMQVQTLSMGYALQFYTLAPLLAQSKMAAMEIKPIENQAGDSGVFGEEFPGYSWQVSFNENESEALGNVAQDLIRVDVTVAFNDDENIYNLRAYKFMKD